MMTEGCRACHLSHLTDAIRLKLLTKLIAVLQ